ncbi:hypothetical protein EVAR_39850_1 [Eumeta japonica]|uniref:Uncharacterized protein n=1 Tax=Eumeta variegata TaxID=151549 RepID=A0A4C1WQD7_EUMVA|nr:hypothetical protein EVAR_39850_1 [Eumeta japonica]
MIQNAMRIDRFQSVLCLKFDLNIEPEPSLNLETTSEFHADLNESPIPRRITDYGLIKKEPSGPNGDAVCETRAGGAGGAGETRAAGGAAPAPSVPTTPCYRLPFAPRRSVNGPAIALAKTSPWIATERNRIAAIVYIGFDIQRGPKTESDVIAFGTKIKNANNNNTAYDINIRVPSDKTKEGAPSRVETESQTVATPTDGLRIRCSTSKTFNPEIIQAKAKQNSILVPSRALVRLYISYLFPPAPDGRTGNPHSRPSIR